MAAKSRAAPSTSRHRPARSNWREQLQALGGSKAREVLDALWNRWEDSLDTCHGACVLRNAELARIVADSLLHFDGERYMMLDFVVMPNHVHILVSFPNEQSMLTQCESWKHFTATQINRRMNRRGRFWQQDAFDHLVRSERQFWYLRDYIAANPRKRACHRANSCTTQSSYSVSTPSVAANQKGPHAEREDYDRSPHAPREDQSTVTKGRAK